MCSNSESLAAISGISFRLCNQNNDKELRLKVEKNYLIKDNHGMYCSKVISKNESLQNELDQETDVVEKLDSKCSLYFTSTLTNERETANSRWSYRGEGNRCLVVADNQNQIVYRLIKQPCKKPPPFVHQDSFKDETERIHRNLKNMSEYMLNVITPHISEHFATKSSLIHLPVELIERITESIYSQRPEHRRNRYLDPACRSALTLPDLCFVKDVPHLSEKSVSVEIKPKRGIFPVNSKRHDTYDVPLACRFCMHQVLKLKQNFWPHKSKYCPIDLFSGNQHRMKNTLLGLVETPQNNLRICQNGSELYPRYSTTELNTQLNDFFHRDTDDHDDKSSLLQLIDLVIKALMWSPLADPDKSSHVSHTLSHTDVCSESVPCCPSDSGLNSHSLPPGCVLERIQNLQRIDRLGIEGIVPLYYHLVNSSTYNDRYRWGIDGPYHKDWLNLGVNDQKVSYEDFAVERIKEFLVSMTASDCSVMVAFQPVTEDETSTNPIIHDYHRNPFLCSIGIIDMDPKPFDKIPTYFEREEEIFDSYRNNHNI